jgi:L-asparaginase II
MNNPILVEILRRNLVESRHRAAVAVTDADGGAVLAIGDVTTPIFERSAVKALQALPLVETGAADALGFGDEELALACASHSGEAGHVAGITRTLAKSGLDAAALRCGAHWPMAQPALVALARTSEPSALRNNCSGRHACFLCVACAKGIDHADYWRPQSGAARGEGGAGGFDRRHAERRPPCHRWLLGSDLGDPVGESGPRLR